MAEQTIQESATATCGICGRPRTAMPADHPCPRRDDCALNNGAVHCFSCHRNWPPDETWIARDVVAAPFVLPPGAEWGDGCWAVTAEYTP